MSMKTHKITETGLLILNGDGNHAVDLSGGQWHGWIFWRHPDGQFVSERRLSPQELFVAELWKKDPEEYKFQVLGYDGTAKIQVS